MGLDPETVNALLKLLGFGDVLTISWVAALSVSVSSLHNDTARANSVHRTTGGIARIDADFYANVRRGRHGSNYLVVVCVC